MTRSITPNSERSPWRSKIGSQHRLRRLARAAPNWSRPLTRDRCPYAEDNNHPPPAPVQPGGPPLLVGSIGPKTIRNAAAWADGLAGTTLDLDVGKQNELFDVAREAWAQAGKPKPHLVTSFWFAFGSPERARAQVHRHLRRYMNWIPAEYVDAMAPMTGWAGSEDELLAVLRKFEGIGADEVQLIPTSSDLDQLRRAADVVERL